MRGMRTTAAAHPPAQDTQDARWISVEDRLPEGITDALAVVLHDGFITRAAYHPDAGWNILFGDPDDDAVVTHWIALPPAPVINQDTQDAKDAG